MHTIDASTVVVDVQGHRDQRNRSQRRDSGDRAASLVDRRQQRRPRTRPIGAKFLSHGVANTQTETGARD